MQLGEVFPSGRRKEILRNIGICVFLTLSAGPIFFGLALLVVQAFSKGGGLSLDNWRFLWGEKPYPYYPQILPVFLNTLYLAVGVASIVTVVSSLLGYMISRMKFPGRSLLLASTLILHAFPAISLLIGLYYVLSLLHALDTVIGVIMAKAGLFIPFGVWVMKGFFDGVSWDIEMSALIDGASRLQALYKVMLPMVAPGLAAISIFSFIAGWSEYLFIVTFIRTPASWTLTSYVNAINTQLGFADPGLLASTSLFYALPVIFFFIFTQKYLMRITVGGMKGGR